MTYIYSPAKHRRSGSSMKKSKGRGDMERYRAARKVLPGFPAGPFERLEDVEHYVLGDWITCLMCGKPYKNLAKHIVCIHHISSADYRVRFNVPTRYPLMVADTRELFAANARRNNLDGRLERALANTNKRKRAKASITPFGRAERVRNILLASNANKGRNVVATDCAWHLEQVANVYGYTSVPPPDGELSWSGYKKRRRREPELKAAHQKARARWEQNHRGSWRRK